MNISFNVTTRPLARQFPFPVRHSLRPSLDATLRAAVAVQIGCPADLSCAGRNPVNKPSLQGVVSSTGFPPARE